MEYTTQKAKDLLAQLKVDKSIKLVDPLLGKICADTTPNQVPVLHQTTVGNDRHTTYVPYDATTWSLGKACPTRIHDRGITGRTNEHVHLSVVGATTASDQTLAALGGPTTSFTIAQFTAEGSVWPITEHHGYIMVTSGDAVHDAQGSHHLLSREKDIAIRTTGAAGSDASATPNQILVQSDTGPVTVQGGGAVTIGSGSNLALSAWSNPDYSDMWNVKGPQFWWQKVGTYSALTIATALACKSLISTWRTILPRPTPAGLASWTPAPAADVIGALISTGFTAATIALGLADWCATIDGNADWAHIGSGNAALTAEKFVGVNGGIATTIYGNLGAYLFSSGGADVLGLIEASLTGIGVASIAGGVSASVGAIGPVKLGSEKSNATVEGQTGVTLSAGAGTVLAQGKTGAKLTSTDGPAAMYGSKQAYVGAGSASGYGIVAKETGMTLGPIVAAALVDAPAANPAVGMEMKGNDASATLKLFVGAAEIQLSATDMSHKALNVTVEGTTVAKIKGASVLLG